MRRKWSFKPTRSDGGAPADPRLRGPGLVPVEAQGLHYRRVAEAEQEGRAVAGVDMLAERPGRHREHVLVFPVEPLAADHRVAGTLDDVIVRAADAAARPRLLAGAQQLHVT